ncbi:MAG: hypothetical protein Q7U07_02350 [Gammaproteobacteria bacterium]|nr:hypothetical protein [Gammaproteobacteria bacterium]
MMGLAYLLAFAVYLLISLGVVRWAIRHARKNGKSVKRWGWGAALIMYGIVFWDWIPTLVTHHYYCATESGFWVYKTLDQWKAENPGVMERLVYNKGAPSTRQGDMDTFTDTYLLNQRINFIVQQSRVFSWLPVYRIEETVIDSKSNEVLVRDATFGSYDRTGSNLKFWMHIERCKTQNHRDQGSLGAIISQFEGAKK